MSTVIINNDFEFNPSDIIGRGSFGTVFKGRLRSCETVFVAVKKLPTEKSYVQEAVVLEQLSQIDCRNILLPFAVKFSKNDLYIVTEFCDQGNLRQLLLRYEYGVPESIARQITIQIVAALAVLHSNAVIHRDLKPENILLQSNNSRLGFLVKVGDFGLARFFGRSTFIGSTCGTILYMAPEIFLGSQLYNEKIDYYSLGVIVTELVTGRISFFSDEDFRAEELLRSYKISEAFFSLQEGLLRTDPVRRFSLERIQAHPFIVGKGKVRSVLRATQVARFEFLKCRRYSSESEGSDSSTGGEQSDSESETKDSSDEEDESEEESGSEQTSSADEEDEEDRNGAFTTSSETPDCFFTLRKFWRNLLKSKKR